MSTQDLNINYDVNSELVDQLRAQVQELQMKLTGKQADPGAPSVHPFARTRDKVAIVGFASHKSLAPYHDDGFEIWGLNELYDHIPWQDAQKQGRLRWFEIHTREVKDESNPFVDFVHSRNNDHAEKLTNLGSNVPVYMQRHWDDISNSVEYPLQDMIVRFGSYFTNSISYMMALAIHFQFKEVHVYGVDMAQATEYSEQRPSCEYFFGIMKGLGIKYHIPGESDLLKRAYLYGWEQKRADAMVVKLQARLKELGARHQHNLNVRSQAEAAIHQLAGAIEDCKYILDAHIGASRSTDMST